MLASTRAWRPMGQWWLRELVNNAQHRTSSLARGIIPSAASFAGDAAFASRAIDWGAQAGVSISIWIDRRQDFGRCAGEYAGAIRPPAGGHAQRTGSERAGQRRIAGAGYQAGFC